MFRVHTPGRYLLDAEGNQFVIEDRPYSKEELTGCKSPTHRVQLRDLDTGELQKAIFPGQPIFEEDIPTPIDFDTMTKKDIKELMTDKTFPKNTTKDELIEAYYAR